MLQVVLAAEGTGAVRTPVALASMHVDVAFQVEGTLGSEGAVGTLQFCTLAVGGVQAAAVVLLVVASLAKV